MSKYLLMKITVSVLILSGCETMGGVGKDLQKLGDTIEDKAKSSE